MSRNFGYRIKIGQFFDDAKLKSYQSHKLHFKFRQINIPPNTVITKRQRQNFYLYKKFACIVAYTGNGIL